MASRETESRHCYASRTRLCLAVFKHVHGTITEPCLETSLFSIRTHQPITGAAVHYVLKLHKLRNLSGIACCLCGTNAVEFDGPVVNESGGFPGQCLAQRYESVDEHPRKGSSSKHRYYPYVFMRNKTLAVITPSRWFRAYRYSIKNPTT